MRKFNEGTYFVFLEIKDLEILNLMISLRQIFMAKESDSAIHLTVRGPYSSQVSLNDLMKWQKKLQEEPVLLANVGSFNNGMETIVYIKVNQDYLRSIWHKPDFPIKDFGFNPHITLYKGVDSKKAIKIKKFLKDEKIALLCREYELVCYKSKSMKLFGPKKMDKTHRFDDLINLGKVKYDILYRAMKAVDDYKYLSISPNHEDPFNQSDNPIDT